MTPRAIRAASTLALAVAMPLFLVACSLLPQRQGERAHTGRPEQRVPVRHLAQMDFGKDAFFAACTEPACPTVTRKSLSVMPAIAALSVLPAPSSQDDTPQPVVDRTGARTAPAFAVERYEVIVPFMSGSARLTAFGKAAIAHALLDARQASRILISGRTDSIGADALNQKLALQRALNVRRYLLQREPALHAAVVTDAKGLCCYTASNDTPEGRQKNRRVEVVFSVPGQVAP